MNNILLVIAIIERKFYFIVRELNKVIVLVRHTQTLSY